MLKPARPSLPRRGCSPDISPGGNEAFADALWHRDSEDRTWEYTYALDEVRPIDIPYTELNLVVGYKPNNVVQGVSVLDEEKSERAFEAFGLFSEDYLLAVSASEFADAERQFDGELDQKVTRLVRKEQSLIRGKLFPSPTASCDLCGESMPREFLIAAHIKKRAACSIEETLDIPNVVMAACVIGCDALFERGYVTVADDWNLLTSTTGGGRYVSERSSG
jgi:hypothetical protein